MNKFNNKNIVLIGMSGAGKTTIGRYIADRLNMKFIDTDDKIVVDKGREIDYIFDKYGEEYFRVLERRVIKDISMHNRTVISTGGGVVLNRYNIDDLRINGIIFLLQASVDTIFNNIKASYLSDAKRPLLNDGSDLKLRIKELYKEREKLYISSADYIINVNDKTIPMIGNEIIFIFNNLYPCS